jgi:hypothetical protein
MSEEILGRINGVRRSKDVMGIQTYNLIFTNNRMIAELIGDTGVALMLFGAPAQTLEERRDYKKAMQMHEQKTPDEILSENKKNFEIKYEDIDKITLKEYLGMYLFHIKFVQKIKKIGRDLAFDVPKDRRAEIEPILLRVFPNKASIKEKRGRFF